MKDLIKRFWAYLGRVGLALRKMIITAPVRFLKWLIKLPVRVILWPFKRSGCVSKVLGCIILILLSCIACSALAVIGVVPVSNLRTFVQSGPEAMIETMIPEAIGNVAATAIDAVIDVGETIITEVAPATASPWPTPAPFTVIYCEGVEVEVLENGGSLRNSPGLLPDNEIRKLEDGESFTAIGSVGLQDGSVWIMVLLPEGYGWIFRNNLVDFQCNPTLSPPTATLSG